MPLLETATAAPRSTARLGDRLSSGGLLVLAASIVTSCGVGVWTIARWLTG